jgi:preprotein translocase subunit SecG
MEAVVLVIHLIVALAIIAVVLIQPSEVGGFLGSSGSMTNMMAPRRTGNILTRLTTILAGIFFLTSLSLALFAEHHAKPASILDIATDQPAVEKTAPATLETSTQTPPDESTLKKAPLSKKEATPKKDKPAAPISQ